MDFPERLHGYARLAFRGLSSAVSLVYLGVVAAAMVLTVADSAFVDHPDASMSGVWMLLFTLPTVLLPLMTGVGGPLLLVAVAAAALVQATVLGLVYHALRGTGSARTRRPSGSAASSAS